MPSGSKRRMSACVSRCCAATRPSGPSPLPIVSADAAAVACRNSRLEIIDPPCVPSLTEGYVVRSCRTLIRPTVSLFFAT